MGHVLVRNLRGHLPAALRRCRALGDLARVRNCASGAFMENRAGGRGRDAAAPSRSWRRGAPWHACTGGVPGDLLDVCAAWAVRDVAQAERLAWCAKLARRVDARACRTAVGVIAPASASAERTCEQVAACWYGRGYAWALLDGVEGAAALRCDDGGTARMQRACHDGVAFRRSATRPDGEHRSRGVVVAWA
jgi:hypothetical protein